MQNNIALLHIIKNIELYSINAAFIVIECIESSLLEPSSHVPPSGGIYRTNFLSTKKIKKIMLLNILSVVTY